MNNLTKIVAAILVMAAFCLALVAWWLGRQPPRAVSSAPTAVVDNSIKYDVVVAARILEAGKAITTDDIRLVSLPINPAGAYSQTSAVVGKVPLIEIGVGTPVTASELSSGLAMKLAQGERAVAIPVDEIVGAGNRVQPGDFVDVFFTLKQGQDVERTQSRLLMSRLRVLSYGAAVIGSASPGGSAGAIPAQQSQQSQSQQIQSSQQVQTQQMQQGQSLPRTAVLATPVVDVNRLLLATQNGKLTLALRNPTDESMPDLALFPAPDTVLSGKKNLNRNELDALKIPDNQAYAGIELAGLAGDARSAPHRSAAAVPQAPKAATVYPGKPSGSVEVIRGTQRESLPF